MSKKSVTTTTPAVAVAPVVKSTLTSAEVLAMFEKSRTADPSKTYATHAEEINAISKASAVASVVTGDEVDWFKFMQGVSYWVISDEGSAEPTAEKSLRVADFLALRKSSKTSKIAINGQLYALLDMFGSNLCTEFHQTRKVDTDTDILWLSKYTSDLDCFKAETRTSVNNMEKQLQVICNTLFTAEKSPRIRKTHVRHLSDRFNKATRNGYTNGNAISLLQEVIYHANDAHTGKVYEVKGRLEAQKPEKPAK